MAKRYKILLCGATGFIGRNLLEYYAKQENTKITAVWHKRPSYDVPANVTWVQGDLRNPQAVDSIVPGHDCIIQAAATTSGAKDIVDTPFIHVTDNAVMNSYLLRAAYTHSIEHFIFFSCSVMYPSQDKPVSEGDFTGTILPQYQGAAWTKVYIERMCEFYAGMGRTRHTVIRHSNIYGPHDKFDFDRSHFFGATISKIMTAKDTMTVWGAGQEKRDLLYVSDLVQFVSAALKKQSGLFGLYNCGSGKAVSVLSVVEQIITASGRSINTEHDLTEPSIAFNLALDSSLAQSELGWCPAVSLADGISNTLQWWKENINPENLKPYAG